MANERITSSGIINPFSNYNIGDNIRLTLPIFTSGTIVNDDRGNTGNAGGGLANYGAANFSSSMTIGNINNLHYYEYAEYNGWGDTDSGGFSWDAISGFVGGPSATGLPFTTMAGSVYVSDARGSGHGIYTALEPIEDSGSGIIEENEFQYLPGNNFDSSYNNLASGISVMLADISGGYVFGDITIPGVSGLQWYDQHTTLINMVLYASDTSDSISFNVSKIQYYNDTSFSDNGNYTFATLDPVGISHIAVGEYTLIEVETTISNVGGSAGDWWIETPIDLKSYGDGYYGLKVERQTGWI